MRTAMQPVRILANWSLTGSRVNQQLSPHARQLARVLCSDTLTNKIVAEQQSITRQLNALSSSVSAMNKMLHALPESTEPCALPDCPPGWKITTASLAGQQVGIAGINLVTECGLKQAAQSPVDDPNQSALAEDNGMMSKIYGRGRVIRVPDFQSDPGLHSFSTGQRIHRGADHTFIIPDDPNTAWAKKGETQHTSFLGDVRFNGVGDHVLSADGRGVFKISGCDSLGKWVVKGESSHSYFSGSGIFNGRGDRCLTYGGDRVLKIWAYQNAGKWGVQAVINNGDWIADALFNAAGDVVLTYSHDGLVRIFASEDSGVWNERAVIAHGHEIDSVSFNGQDDHILICGTDNIARVWGLDESAQWCEKAVVCHTKELNGAIFSDFGDLVVTFSEDGTAIILGCDQHGNWLEQGLIEHNSPIDGAIINDSQDCIVTYCERGIVKVWTRHYC